MKKLNYFATVFMTVLLCVGFASCNNEIDDPVDLNPVEKKICTVSINTKGIVSVEEEPLGRAEETTSNDLYLIHVKQKNGTNYETYAHGLFNQLSNITVQLIEGETYFVEAVAVKDGKNKIASSDGFYRYPFEANLTNNFVYDDETYVFNPPLYVLKGTNDNTTAQIIPGLEVYLGNMTSFGDYEAKENGDAIVIEFIRFLACAAEFKVVDMPEGYLKINISTKPLAHNNETFTTDDIIVQNVNTPNFQYITFGYMFYSKLADGDGVPCTLNFTWVKSNGNEITLTPSDITFKRDTKYNITIKVDNTTTPAITVNPISNYNFTKTEDVNIMGQPIPTGNQ